MGHATIREEDLGSQAITSCSACSTEASLSGLPSRRGLYGITSLIVYDIVAYQIADFVRFSVPLSMLVSQAP